MKLVKMDPQPYSGVHAIVQVLDPWHADAFIGTRAEGRIVSYGPRAKVWVAEDWCGNVIGCLDAPEDATGVAYIDDTWFWEMPD